MNTEIIQTTKVHFHKYAGWIMVAAIMVMITGVSIAEGKWIYSAALLAAFAAVFISIKNPFIFPFGLYVFLIPFDSLLALTGSQGATLTKFLGILTIIILFIKGSFEKKLKRPDNVSIWLTLFFVYAFSSIIWAIVPGLMTSTISTMAGLLVLYLVVTCYRISKSELDTIKWFILAGGLLAAAATIYEFTNDITYASFGGRATLLLDDRIVGPNKLAFDMLFPLSVGLAMMLEKKQLIVKTVLLLILGAIVFGLFLTGSRGGLAGAATILIVYMVFSKKRTTLGIIFAVAAVIVIPIIPEFFFQRMGDALETHAAGRGDIWVVGLAALEKYWLLGAGQDNFAKAYTDFANYAPVFVGLDRAPHNLFLGTFVELGIVGLSLMVAAMISHYRILRPQINKYGPVNDTIMLKASFWGMLVSSLSLDTFLYKSYWLLWMMILLYKNVFLREK